MDTLPLPSEQKLDSDPHEPAAETTSPRSLFEMRHDFRFFTPSLLLTHGKMSRDPVQAYVQMRGRDDAGGPFAVDAAETFFAGLPTTRLGRWGDVVDWNRRLYAIHKDKWQDCLDYLAGITIIDKDAPYVASVGYYNLSVVDVTHYGPGGLTTAFETIDVTIFGLDSTRGRVYIAPAVNEPVGKPMPVVDPPSENALAILSRMHAYDFAPEGYFAHQPLELPSVSHGSTKQSGGAA